MKTIICVSLFFLVQHFTFAQQSYFTIKKDSSGFSLTDKGVAYLSSLPLKCILQEFPYKTSHTSVTDSDHVLLPKQLHPAFYGCFRLAFISAWPLDAHQALKTISTNE
jgi:hypothetical protein